MNEAEIKQIIDGMRKAGFGGNLGIGGMSYQPPTQETDAYLDRSGASPPASGTSYSVLATTKNVRVKAICTNIAFTVQPNPLEVHGVIDGITYLWTMTNPATATYYYCMIDSRNAQNAQGFVTTQPDPNRAFLIEGRSISINAEITGGTVQTLQCRVVHAKW